MAPLPKFEIDSAKGDRNVAHSCSDHRPGCVLDAGLDRLLCRYSTLHDLGFLALIPAAILLVLVWALLRKSSTAGLAALIRDGAVAGALATVSLKAVRYLGWMGFMPSNLPELMGVLFDRFALEPTGASTLGGFAYHFRNGACFGISFALGRFKLRVRWAVPSEPLLASVSSSVPRSRD
jgi:hypothetical protein